MQADLIYNCTPGSPSSEVAVTATGVVQSGHTRWVGRWISLGCRTSQHTQNSRTDKRAESLRMKLKEVSFNDIFIYVQKPSALHFPSSIKIIKILNLSDTTHHPPHSAGTKPEAPSKGQDHHQCSLPNPLPRRKASRTTSPRTTRSTRM